MNSRPIASNERSIEELREEFWSEISGRRVIAADPDAGEAAPAWHSLVPRFGVWAVALVGIQAMAAVSLGEFFEKAGDIGASQAVAIPVFLGFLLLNGIGLRFLPKSAERRSGWAFYSALALAALLMSFTHPAWSGGWNLAEVLTGMPGSTL